MDSTNLIAQSFVERCLREDPEEEIERAFGVAMAQLGFRAYAVCADVNPAQRVPGAVIVHNYPTPWCEYFVGAELYRIDPVWLRARSSRTPFWWNSPEFLAQVTPVGHRVLAAASTHGLNGGYSVPIRLSWWPHARRASCSLVPDSLSVPFRHCEIAEQMATVLYASALHRHISQAGHATAPLLLSPRTRQCLELCANGRTDWETSEILHISESSVHTHLTRAMHRLRVTTRAHLLAYGLITGQIAYGDVVRPPGGPELLDSARDFGGVAQQPTIDEPNHRSVAMRMDAEEERVSREAATWYECREEGMTQAQRLRYIRWLKRSPAHVAAMLFYEQYCGWLKTQDDVLTRH